MENDKVVRLVTALKESLEREIHAVETRLEHRLQREIQGVESRLEQKIGDRLEVLETKLLTEFQKWAAPAEAVRRSHSSVLRALDVRLEGVEDRLKQLKDWRNQKQ